MGKFPASKLRSLYSDWHYNELGKHTYGMDIDFLETRIHNGKPVIVAITEICRFGDKLTWQQQNIYPILKDKLGVPVFIVECDESFTKFIVHELNSIERWKMTPDDYKYFLNRLQSPNDINNALKKFKSKNK